MSFKAGHTPANKGKTTTTQPIRGDGIDRIRELLQDRPRDLALWSVGTNTALRASDLLALRWDALEDDGVRIAFRVKEQKTGKLRLLTLNPRTSADLRGWRAHAECEWCFSGQRGRMTSATLGRLVKQWAADAGVKGQIASHSLRKTFCRAMVDKFDEPLFKIMWALGHSTERQTAQYLGLLQDDVAALYEHVV